MMEIRGISKIHLVCIFKKITKLIRKLNFADINISNSLFSSWPYLSNSNTASPATEALTKHSAIAAAISARFLCRTTILTSTSFFCTKFLPSSSFSNPTGFCGEGETGCWIKIGGVRSETASGSPEEKTVKAVAVCRSEWRYAAWAEARWWRDWIVVFMRLRRSRHRRTVSSFRALEVAQPICEMR